MFIVIFIISLSLFLLSCAKKNKAQEGNSKKEDGKNYIIFVNADSPDENKMYSIEVESKDKKSIYQKNVLNAAGIDGKIAVLSEEKGKTGLYTINADGSGKVAVLKDFPIKNSYVSWSPDKKKITFAARKTGDKSDEIYYVETDENKGPVKVTDDGLTDADPKFSNSGETIAYDKKSGGNYDIFLYEISPLRNVNLSKNAANDISPVLKTDGTRMLFLSDEAEAGKYNLYSMNMDGSGRYPLTSGLNIDRHSVDVSPDGSMAAFVSVDDRKNKSLHVIDMSKKTVMVSNGSYISAWSDDSKKLYFASSDDKEMKRKIIEYDIQEGVMKDTVKVQYKPGEEAEGIKFIYFTDKLK